MVAEESLTIVSSVGKIQAAFSHFCRPCARAPCITFLCMRQTMVKGGEFHAPHSFPFAQQYFLPCKIPKISTDLEAFQCVSTGRGDGVPPWLTLVWFPCRPKIRDVEGSPIPDVQVPINTEYKLPCVSVVLEPTRVSVVAIRSGV